MHIARSLVLNYTAFFKVSLGVLSIFAGAQITIHVGTIPITLQTLVVLVIGLLYRPRESLLTLLAYIGCGASGMPVFHSYRFGISVITGPSGGYLLGMLMAVYLMSSVREKYDVTSYTGLVGVCLLGQLIVFAMGVSWLSYMIGYEQAFIDGFLVFIPSGVVKTLLLASIIRYIRVNHSNSI